jgi:hypothetical protein
MAFPWFLAADRQAGDIGGVARPREGVFRNFRKFFEMSMVSDFLGIDGNQRLGQNLHSGKAVDKFLGLQ